MCCAGHWYFCEEFVFRLVNLFSPYVVYMFMFLGAYPICLLLYRRLRIPLRTNGWSHIEQAKQIEFAVWNKKVLLEQKQQMLQICQQQKKTVTRGRHEFANEFVLFQRYTNKGYFQQSDVCHAILLLNWIDFWLDAVGSPWGDIANKSSILGGDCVIHFGHNHCLQY